MIMNLDRAFPVFSVTFAVLYLLATYFIKPTTSNSRGSAKALMASRGN